MKNGAGHISGKVHYGTVVLVVMSVTSTCLGIGGNSSRAEHVRCAVNALKEDRKTLYEHGTSTRSYVSSVGQRAVVIHKGANRYSCYSGFTFSLIDRLID